MQAHSRWLHAIRKGVITEKKWGLKKYENAQLFLQTCTHLTITRLCKYPIDPKAYLGRCSNTSCLLNRARLTVQRSEEASLGGGGFEVYVPVNRYGDVETVSTPNHTFSWTSLPKRLTSTSCTYFPLVTDNPSWISGRRRITIEIISWSTSTKVWGWAGSNSRPLDLQQDSHLLPDMLLTALRSPVRPFINMSFYYWQ